MPSRFESRNLAVAIFGDWTRVLWHVLLNDTEDPYPRDAGRESI